MDLVEIRRKAGREKQGRKDPRPEPSAATKVEEPVPEPPVDADEAVTEPSPSASAAAADDLEYALETRSGEDALEQLFTARQDFALATEESYLQAFQGGDNETRLDLQRWLAFSLGNERYAVNIEFVNEIIKPREVTEIPRVPDFLLGIISLRGIIVPVVDLRRRLNLGVVAVDDRARILVCEEKDRIVGLLVDNITQVIQLGADEIEPPPAILTGLNRELVEGVGRIRGQMVILLDLPQVLDMEMHGTEERSGVWERKY